MGDFVRINWGTPPNVLSPVGTPPGAGIDIFIQTPEGPVKLTWSNDDPGYFGDGFSLVKEDLVWVLSSGSETVAEFTNFICEKYPEGYKFIRSSGPPIDYKIIRYQHQLDDRGHYHHTTVQTELQNDDFMVQL